ncbi:MAG: putative transcriptional regulator [Pedosphaera sp.]|nr:putative transcriptional regulator [Pedosphaera sp.]
MSKVPHISEAEWKVMEVLWAHSPLLSHEITEALADKTSWHANTVKTYLARLRNKKAVGVKKVKNSFLYHPLVTRAECVEAESESFLQQIFGGTVKPLLLHFADKQKISVADLDELKSLLKKRK